jgi:hypothetical protein
MKRKRPAGAGRFHFTTAANQCFFFSVFLVAVPVVAVVAVVPPIVVVPVVPDVVVAVVPVVFVALVSVTIVPDVSVAVPVGMADVDVEPVVLDIAVPAVSLVVIVDDVSVVVVSCFLQANMKTASATTIRIVNVFFILFSG